MNTNDDIIINIQQKKSKKKPLEADKEITMNKESPSKKDKNIVNLTCKDMDDLKIYLKNNLSDEDSSSLKDVYGVFFSGGYDSTALMIQHLIAGDKVFPIYLNFNSLLHQHIMTQLVLYKLDSIFPNQLYPLFNIASMEGVRLMSYGSLTQQPMMAFFAGLAGIKCKQIEFGYCLKDCAASYINEIKSLYEITASFENKSPYTIQPINYYNAIPAPKLAFPLLKCGHEDNICYVKSFMNKYGSLPIITYGDTNILGQYNKKTEMLNFTVYGNRDNFNSEDKTEDFDVMNVSIPKKITNFINSCSGKEQKILCTKNFEVSEKA